MNAIELAILLRARDEALAVLRPHLVGLAALEIVYGPGLRAQRDFAAAEAAQLMGTNVPTNEGQAREIVPLARVEELR